MFTTIIACIIANILTLVIFAAIAYYFVKKYKAEIEAKVDKVKDSIADVKEAIGTISAGMGSVDEIKSKLDDLIGKFS